MIIDLISNLELFRISDAIFNTGAYKFDFNCSS